MTLSGDGDGRVGELMVTGAVELPTVGVVMPTGESEFSVGAISGILVGMFKGNFVGKAAIVGLPGENGAGTSGFELGLVVDAVGLLTGAIGISVGTMGNSVGPFAVGLLTGADGAFVLGVDGAEGLATGLSLGEPPIIGADGAVGVEGRGATGLSLGEPPTVGAGRVEGVEGLPTGFSLGKLTVGAEGLAKGLSLGEPSIVGTNGFVGVEGLPTGLSLGGEPTVGADGVEGLAA
jgi:hypothetical protein